jgi:hypothetical protein
MPRSTHPFASVGPSRYGLERLCHAPQRLTAVGDRLTVRIAVQFVPLSMVWLKSISSVTVGPPFESARGWRLPPRAGLCLIDACPRRRGVCPYRQRRLGEFGVIQRTCPQDQQVRARFRPARYGRSAALAELPVHAVAAVGAARIIAQRSGDGDRGGRKYHIYGCAPGGKVLTVAAPADSCCNGVRVNAVAHCSAKTSACDGHRALLHSAFLLLG